MPWKEITEVEARVRFVEDWLSKSFESVAVLCRAHGVSRKTGYKWLERFREGGTPGLRDQPRRWRSHPHTTAADVVELVVGTRKRHPTWGPRKLKAWITGRGYECPSASTIGAILAREGFIAPTRRKERAGEYSDGLTAQDAPNAVWGADFKGWFKLRTGAKCYPLTVSDGYSRYLLRCDALAHPDEEACRKAFDGLFREHGLPHVLRTDNGTPFSGRFGISALSVWWVKLGIKPERIQRGKPTQNGRHERIHRTLKADALRRGVAYRMYLQQRVFDRFRHEYNTERPHEALDYRVPAALYQPSPRTYPVKLRSPEYARDRDVYVVRSDGSIRMPGRDLLLSPILRGEPVCVEISDDDRMVIKYGPLSLGILTSHGRFVRGARPRRQNWDDAANDLTAAQTDNQTPEMVQIID
jgi:transposase InsO family protein